MPNPATRSAVDPYDPRRDRDPREPVDIPKREEPDDDPVEDPLEQPPVHDPGEIPEDEPIRRDPDPREPARQVILLARRNNLAGESCPVRFPRKISLGSLPL